MSEFKINNQIPHYEEISIDIQDEILNISSLIREIANTEERASDFESYMFDNIGASCAKIDRTHANSLKLSLVQAVWVILCKDPKIEFIHPAITISRKKNSEIKEVTFADDLSQWATLKLNRGEKNE